MKNWKCIIGATVLAPICAAIGLMIGYSGIWILENVPIVKYIIFVVAVIVCLGILFLIWLALFDHCKKHWQKKE